jgi:hypothetical protein
MQTDDMTKWLSKKEAALYSEPCSDCDGDGYWYADEKKVACPTCGGHEDSAGDGKKLDYDILAALEALAAERKQNAEYRRLMKKHQWIKGLSDRFMFECLECGATTNQTSLNLESARKAHPNEFNHKPFCAWAAAIDRGE